MVLRAHACESRGSAFEEALGRAISEDAILWGLADDGVAQETEGNRERQTGSALASGNGFDGPVSEAEPEQAGAGAQNLSIPAARLGDSETQSGVEHGHHLHTAQAGVCLSGGGD